MSNATSAAPSGRVPAWALATGYRVIIHPPVCPECGSDDVFDENVEIKDVETGDGVTETARICRSCGTAWPVACVCDWTTADVSRPVT
jgi:hypothetical protein